MEVINEFKKTRKEKEENYRYLQTIVQHINIGMLAYTPDGNVELLNSAAKKLLKINSLRNISELNHLSKSLVESLLKIKTGDKILEKVIDNNELLQLSIFAAEFKLGTKHIILVSLNNIQSELEEKEMEAWQNLIRVLTHEIMNSITPIISLSSTVNNILENNDEHFSAETIDDIKGAITTILRRSNGLIHFVDSYRSLTRIPVPNFNIINLSVLFDRLKKLLNEEFTKNKVNFSYKIEPENLELTADQDLIEQVIINLIVNSINACSNNVEPCIQLIGRFDIRGNITIQVIDNGSGIPEDLQEKIFIPFFTTKKEGSGIGLSLSRQIMRIHKGSISVTSIPDKETIFTLRF
jgi:nitrogen fixation/metabolism regulation signal transduction histidine kinase